MATQESTPDAPHVPALTTFYNGACPVCRTEIHHYRAIASKDPTLAWHDVSGGRGALAERGIDEAGATRRLYAIDDSGTLYGGVDAFIQVWRRLPRYRWLERLVAAPVVRPIAGAVYEGLLAPLLFRWNRFRGRRHTY